MAFVRTLLAASLVLGLSACADTVEYKAKAVDRTPLNIEMPAPLVLDDVQWSVHKTDTGQYVFGLSDEDFKKNTLNEDKKTSLLSIQRKIIQQYKDYYEMPKTP